MLDEPDCALPGTAPTTSTTRKAKAKIEKKRLLRFIALLRINQWFQ
ncbi:hypothetical protein ACP_3022 [Acidobacterium capsulatum ATCC 51196]|uniref:Uncharacterized protein n=1 Tax=Acidobacterium capsulatum (strain ATCC 51196 / DSM 11244 / BCRC 80197 / JCM 7670 / NBRC 15755 / NCIMB 13165 / 161) TaxID=240015 RepID=C1F4H9_ACIC5|nr:hypothetical protein ACP_3022 [Acidobacterium capsulatum ATCC 51196]